MNSSQKKKRISFNVIDVLLIIVAFVAIISLIFILRNRNVITSSKDQTVDIRYTVKIAPLREEFRSNIQIGDYVTDPSNMNGLGEVINLFAPNQYLYEGTNNLTGEKVYTPYPGMVELTVTIQVKATKTVSGYEINGQELLIGRSISLRVPNLTATGVVTTVTPVEID